MGIEVRAVRSPKDLDRFVMLPWRLYKGDRYWVPPLISEEKKLLDRSAHPFHKHAEVEYFFAEKDGAPVGRIAAVVNRRHNEFHGEKTGFFGFFECGDDSATANALFRSAEEWLKAKGMVVCRGPCNPSTNETCGTLVEGFDSPPTIMMTYNPPYHDSLIRSCGYDKAMDLLAFSINPQQVVTEKFERLSAALLHRSPIVLRNIDLANFEKELETVLRIYNDAWEKNWGFVPMTEEEFISSAHALKSIILPEFAYIAEVGGVPAGFAIALPDINEILIKLNGRLFPFGWLKILIGKKRVRRLRVVALGIIPKYRKLGLGSLFYLQFIKVGLRLKYEGAEMSWILEDNDQMIRPILLAGGRPSKRYRLYEKPLS